MIKTFWLSFVNNDGNVGCCVIDVSEEEAADHLVILTTAFPNHLPGAEWVAAATAKAWEVGCNPGGQVMSLEIQPSLGDKLPHNRLMQREKLERLGLI